MAKVIILHDNEKWIEPLVSTLEDRDVENEAWHLNSFEFNYHEAPPAAVFFNRSSPSSYSRGAVNSMNNSKRVLEWLKKHGRKVFGGERALELEMSKEKQADALIASSLNGFVPKTFGAQKENIYHVASAHFKAQPFFLKHNRSGSGVGVFKFGSIPALLEYLESPQFEESPDGKYVLMENIQSTHNEMYRLEFIDGKFVYAMRIQTSSTSFSNCPADSCNEGLNLMRFDSNCPAAAAAAATSQETVARNEFSFDFAPSVAAPQADFFIDFNAPSPLPAKPKFAVVTDFSDPIVPLLEAFLVENGCFTAGIEIIYHAERGTPYIIDANVLNTNYNRKAEKAAGMEGRAHDLLVDALLR